MGHLLFSDQKYRPLVRGDPNSLCLGEGISLEWNQASGGEQGILSQARVCIWAVCYRKKRGLEVKRNWSLVSGSASNSVVFKSFDFSSFVYEMRALY